MTRRPANGTKTIRYKGSAARVGALVQALEEESIQVDWTPPKEQRGFGADATAVVVSIVASGSYDAIKLVVAKMLTCMPHAEIVIEDNQDDQAAEPHVKPTVTDPKPETIAQWMLDRIEKSGHLYQTDAVHGISDLFGEEFTYLNDNGNPAIDKRVLRAFKKITGNTVVWERWDFCWRKRAEGDAPGRKQE